MRVVEIALLSQVNIQINIFSRVYHTQIDSVSSSLPPSDYTRTFSILEIISLESLPQEQGLMNFNVISSECNKIEKYAIDCDSRQDLERFTKNFVDLKFRQKERERNGHI